MEEARHGSAQAGYDHESPSFEVNAFLNGCLIENTHVFESFDGIDSLQGGRNWDRRAISIH